MGAEIVDLRKDVDDALVSLESGSGLPFIHELVFDKTHKAATAPLGLEAIEGVSDTQDTIATIKGSVLDAGLGYDSLTHLAANEKIRITSLIPGKSGLTVAFVSAGNENITKSGDDITINFNAGASTAQTLRTAIKAEAAVNRLISADFDGGNGGEAWEAGDALAKTALAGGSTLRKGKAPVVRLAGITTTLLAGITASAYNADDAQPSATELRIFFDVDNAALDALLADGQAGRRVMLEIEIDGYRLAEWVHIVDSA